MFDLSPLGFVFVFAVAAFAAASAFMDIRTKRIPNKLTLPMFFAGWVYQIIASFLYGWHHLGSAALGFLVGFGILYLIWFVGGGGGGDVKLVGALSVWLGFRMTLHVLVASTLLVLVVTTIVVVRSVLGGGLREAKKKYLATGKTPAGQKAKKETTEDKISRRVMTYAGPVALATWIVLAWNFPTIDPAYVEAAEQPAAKQVQSEESATPEAAPEDNAEVTE